MKSKMNRNKEGTDVATNLRTLYIENGLHHRYMIDWRHRVIARFSISVVFFFLLAKWIWDIGNIEAKAYLFIPFSLLAIASLVFWFMDKRNVQRVKSCEQAGKVLEDQLANIGGFYNVIAKEKPLVSYTGLFTFIYVGTSAIFLIIAGIMLIRYTI